MENTSQVADRIGKIVDESGGKKTDFAKRLGIDYKTQRNYLNGKTKPSFDFLQKLSAAGEDVMYVITGEKSVPDGFVRIPKMSATGSMGLGIPSDLPHDEVIECVILDEQWVRMTLVNFSNIHNLRIVTGQGDSMSPTFEEGDSLFVDIGVTEFANDAVYLYELDGRILIKRLQRTTSGVIRVICDNKNYPIDTIEEDEQDQLRIIGRIVGKWALTRF